MSAAAVSPPVVVTPVVDPTPAALSPPAVDPAPAAEAVEPKATPTEGLNKFVEKHIPKYKETGRHSDSDYRHKIHEKTQSDDDKEFKAQQEQIKKDIYVKIKKIIEDADVKYKELSEKYKAAKSNYNLDPTEENYKKLNEISVSIDAVYYEKSEALDKIQKVLDGDTTPTLLRWGKSLGNYGFNIIIAKFMKSQLEAQALEVAESTMNILVKKTKETSNNAEKGEGVNIDNMAKWTELAEKIADQNTPPPTSSSPSEPGLLGDAAAAVTGTDPAAAAAAAAAKALTGAADTAAGKIPTLPTLPAPPADLVPIPPSPSPIAPPMAVAAGGGISRKRSHPKYINQISENRNKIFKKELEIINSIRRFHRSHTIRKRDKINSILGFKKSRNNRNRNHGNTKRHRHQHRHNNHKHKSAKHIKK